MCGRHHIVMLTCVWYTRTFDAWLQRYVHALSAQRNKRLCTHAYMYVCMYVCMYARTCVDVCTHHVPTCLSQWPQRHRGHSHTHHSHTHHSFQLIIDTLTVFVTAITILGRLHECIVKRRIRVHNNHHWFFALPKHPRWRYYQRRSGKCEVCVEWHYIDLFARHATLRDDCAKPHHTPNKLVQGGWIAAFTRSCRGNPGLCRIKHIVIGPWTLCSPPHHFVLISRRAAVLVLIVLLWCGVHCITVQQGCSHVTGSRGKRNCTGEGGAGKREEIRYRFIVMQKYVGVHRE